MRGLNAIIGNNSKGSATILGEWKTASHVERTGERPPVPAAPLAAVVSSAPAPAVAHSVTARA